MPEISKDDRRNYLSIKGNPTGQGTAPKQTSKECISL